MMKTHAPWQLLPGRPMGDEPCPCKAIYVTRNPKDACVSMYYHAQGGWGFSVTSQTNLKIYDRTFFF